MAKTELLRVKALPCIGKKTSISLVLNFAELKISETDIHCMFGGGKKKSYRSYISVKISIVTSVRKKEHLKFGFGID